MRRVASSMLTPEMGDSVRTSGCWCSVVDDVLLVDAMRMDTLWYYIIELVVRYYYSENLLEMVSALPQRREDEEGRPSV